MGIYQGKNTILWITMIGFLPAFVLTWMIWVDSLVLWGEVKMTFPIIPILGGFFPGIGIGRLFLKRNGWKNAFFWTQMCYLLVSLGLAFSFDIESFTFFCWGFGLMVGITIYLLIAYFSKRGSKKQNVLAWGLLLLSALIGVLAAILLKHIIFPTLNIRWFLSLEMVVAIILAIRMLDAFETNPNRMA